MKITRSLYIGLVVLLAFQSTSVSARGLKYKESAEHLVYPNAFLEFLALPNSDEPKSGVVRVYLDGSKGKFGCKGCSIDYKLNGKKVNIYDGGTVMRFLVKDFANLSDQLAKVVVDSELNIISIYFNEIRLKESVFQD